MTTSASQKVSQVRWITVAFWLLVFLVICSDVGLKPAQHTTTPTYRAAATEWWQTHDLYTYRAHDGFFYFPQAALIFSPFNALPYLVGEIVWRAFTFGLFAYALVRLWQVFLSGRASTGKTFLFLSLLAVPSAFASLRNAQFDLPLAALVVLAAAEVASARWTAATVFLCLGVALKPLAVVPLLLFTALYWKLIPRVIVGLVIVAVFPFLTETPVYVVHEYIRCYQALQIASVGEEARYSDLAALLSHVGYDAPTALKTGARIFFALAYLGLGALAIRRLNRVHAAWTVGALAADYLMLFNPRTETCSYVFLGPFVASLALLYMHQPSRKWLGYALAFGAIGFACDAFPKIDGFSIHDMTDRWLKPLIALLFLPVLIEFIFQKQPRHSSHHEQRT
jgi:alpha-1,2-mannosyltransferase